jgi:hypothetical protein
MRQSRTANAPHICLHWRGCFISPNTIFSPADERNGDARRNVHRSAWLDTAGQDAKQGRQGNNCRFHSEQHSTCQGGALVPDYAAACAVPGLSAGSRRAVGGASAGSRRGVGGQSAGRSIRRAMLRGTLGMGYALA